MVDLDGCFFSLPPPPSSFPSAISLPPGYTFKDKFSSSCPILRSLFKCFWHTFSKPWLWCFYLVPLCYGATSFWFLVPISFEISSYKHQVIQASSLRASSSTGGPGLNCVFYFGSTCLVASVLSEQDVYLLWAFFSRTISQIL
jgi:hypothetical protein